MAKVVIETIGIGDSIEEVVELQEVAVGGTDKIEGDLLLLETIEEVRIFIFV